MKAFKLYLTVLILFSTSTVSCFGQTTTYNYALVEDFTAIQSGAPDLIQIPNNSGLTGEFITRLIPASTCGNGGNADGYFFEDDAGLQFNNSSSFINQSYSLAFNFQIDEFISPPSWVQILSFTHIDDIGVYIYLTNPPTNGTLQFWPYGNVGEDNYFTTVDFYQMILVRSNTGLIKVYVNGEEFAEYDDSATQKFIPGDPDNFIVFFRDDPSVLANEASPSFVSDIKISNYAWTSDEVSQVWEDFCKSLIGINKTSELQTQIFPNPVQDILNISLEKSSVKADVQIFDLLGQIQTEVRIQGNINSIDVSTLENGLYLIKVVQDNSMKVMKFKKG